MILLPEGIEIDGLDDSKKLSEKRREELFEIICERAEAYNIASASVEEIDRVNILQATFLAMRRALDGLSIRPDFALVDGNRDPLLQRAVCPDCEGRQPFRNRFRRRRYWQR